jgi:5-amino-6-(5-phosphoribosylamino)uracil reductase
MIRLIMKLIHVSAAMSLDGHIDDQTDHRLCLSTEEDLHDMYIARSKCDAVLVGANTLRKDNPSLTCHSPELTAQRLQRGQSAEPTRVTVTHSGNLDPESEFFMRGQSEKIILCPGHSTISIDKKLASAAKIIMIKDINAKNIVTTLEKYGIQSLFVEGGTSILTMFLSEGMFHRLRLAIAPFFVGSRQAPMLLNDAIFKNNDKNRLRIASVHNLGNMAVLDMINDNFIG